VLTLVGEAIAALAPNRDAAVTADARLVEDLEYHSLALVELAILLEDEFALERIDVESAKSIERVADVQRYVLDRLEERGALVEGAS